MENRLLKCKLDSGMMAGELAATVTASNGEVSLFVAEDLASRDGTDGWIPVSLLDEDAKYGLVRLPQASIEGPQVVKVAKSQLKTAQ